MNITAEPVSTEKRHIKTREEVRENLARSGISIAQWADWNDLPRTTVYNLLYGRLTGARGKAHQAAVILGLKDGILN